MMEGCKDLPEEWYEEDHRDALDTMRCRVPSELKQAENLVDGVQDWFDHRDEDTSDVQHVEKIEWSNDLSGIELLEELHRNGELSAEQGARLETVLAKLKKGRPLLEKMQARLPDFWPDVDANA